MFIGWIIGVAAIGVLVDVLGPDAVAASGIGFVILTLVGQAMVTQKILSSSGVVVHATSLRLGTVFLIGLITSMGVGLGLILLLLPGIYLLARWSLSVPALLTTNGSAMDAIGKSWEMTHLHALPLSIMFFVIYIPTNGIGTLVNWVGTDNSGVTALGPSVIANLLIELGAVTAWFACAAAYIELGGRRNQIADIFG